MPKKLAQKSPGRPASSVSVNVRLPKPLADAVDRYAREQSKLSGFSINRSAAIRKLVAMGLEADLNLGGLFEKKDRGS